MGCTNGVKSSFACLTVVYIVSESRNERKPDFATWGPLAADAEGAASHI